MADLDSISYSNYSCPKYSRQKYLYVCNKNNNDNHCENSKTTVLYNVKRAFS